MSYRDLAKYIRTCQECGSKQEARDVQSYKGDGWKDLKCKRCGSESMDYGSWRHADDCQCDYCKEDME
jgi:hypothetical protein